jgi:predicted esterase
MKNPACNIIWLASCLVLAGRIDCADKPAVDSGAKPGESSAKDNSAGGNATLKKMAGMAGFPSEKSTAKSELAEGFGPPAGGWPANAKKGFLKAVKVEGIDEPRAFYHLDVPNDYSAEKPWPLVMVLHGGPSGHAGDLVGVLAGRIVKNKAIAVFPEALRAQVLEWNYPHEGAYLLHVIRQVAKTYRIDPCRVYLIGHSMGGGGTYANGAILSDMWAGIGPMSGWYWTGSAPRPKPEFINWLKTMPTYILHGDKDPAVPVKLGQMADADLKRIGNTDYIYRELPGVGHDVPNHGEELDKLLEWLMKHKKPVPANFQEAAKKLAEWGALYQWTPGEPIGSYAGDKQAQQGPAKK